MTASGVRKLGFGARVVCGCAMMAAWTTVSLAQAAGSAAQAAAVVAPAIHFDVVSIKQSKDRNAPRGLSMPAGGDGVRFTNVPMLVVILAAYDFKNYTLTFGLPDWTIADRYDVVVKVSDADVAAYHQLKGAQRRLMLREALEERLKLKAHLEQRPVLVYDLVVAKNGPKMQLAKEGDTYPNGFKAAPGQTILFEPPSHLVAQAATAGELATRMSDLGDYSIGRQVFDKTGLTGRYDFSLQWTPEMKGAADSDSEGASGGAESAGPSLFTAVQQQLGLKLDSAKEPVECLIIDHAERPSEN
jgi:uncharacterized protein (TIGR03435 family)